MYAKIENLSQDALRRLFNGPLESFNNIPSALRSQSHDISNFEFARNRMRWAIREVATIKFHPRCDEEIHTTGKKRGPYKNNILNQIIEMMDPDKNTSGKPILYQLFQRCSFFSKLRLMTPHSLNKPH